MLNPFFHPHNEIILSGIHDMLYFQELSVRFLEHLYRVEYYVIVIPWVVRLHVEIIHEL